MKLSQIAAVFLFATALSAESEIRTASITLLTPNADETSARILKSAENLGGRLQNQNARSLVVLVPGLGPEEAIEKLVPGGCTLVSKQSARKDTGERRLELRAAIDSKRKHLENLRKLFDETDFSQTLEIEKEYLNAVQELERLLGEYKYLEESARYTTLTFQFQLEAVSTAPVQIPAFPWMADRGVEQVLSAMEEP